MIRKSCLTLIFSFLFLFLSVVPAFAVENPLAVEFFVKNKGKLSNKVYVLPKELDIKVASLKLEAMGISIDKLTTEQQKYLSSWTEGTQ